MASAFYFNSYPSTWNLYNFNSIDVAMLLKINSFDVYNESNISIITIPWYWYN